MCRKPTENGKHVAFETGGVLQRVQPMQESPAKVKRANQEDKHHIKKPGSAAAKLPPVPPNRHTSLHIPLPDKTVESQTVPATLRGLKKNAVLDESNRISSETFKKLELLAEISAKKSKRKNSFPKTYIHASTLDDITLRKTLTDAFQGEPGTYLAAVQEIVENPLIPHTLIPEEYFVYSNSPIQQGFSSAEEVLLNEENKTWEKLIFPTSKPLRRVEIFLLARTMDEMLSAISEGEKAPKECVYVDRISTCN
jgi:hypothetical protein